jgi:hypothetical protein
VTYKYVVFGLDTGFIVHSLLTTLMITISSGTLTNSHSYSLCNAVTITYSLQFTELTR